MFEAEGTAWLCVFRIRDQYTTNFQSQGRSSLELDCNLFRPLYNRTVAVCSPHVRLRVSSPPSLTSEDCLGIGLERLFEVEKARI